MEDIIIDLPIRLRRGKKKISYFGLNLNVYRNADFHTLNNMKIKFETIIKEKVKLLPEMERTNLTYTLFFGSKRLVDLANVCSIVDKFFSDTLVNHNKLPDDNSEIISKICYQWGGIDKDNPRIEVTLSEIELKKEQPMKIIYTQDEIEEAVRVFLGSQITIREDQFVNITFHQEENGIQANVIVGKSGTKEPTPTVVVTKALAPSQHVPEKPQEVVTSSLATKVPTPVMSPPVTAPVVPKAVFPSMSAPVPEEEAPKPVSRSLFGNLTPPVHDPKPGV